MRRHVFISIATLSALTACAHRSGGPPWRAGCSPPSPSATTFTSADAARLVGAWEVTTVTTTPGLPHRVHTVYVELALTDSAERFYRPRAFPNAPLREQPLTGRLVYESEGHDVSLPLRLRGTYIVPDDAGGPCLDCGPSVYEVQRLTEQAFWGGYGRSGGGSVVRRTADGHLVDGDDGVMCARRVSPRASRVP